MSSSLTRSIGDQRILAIEFVLGPELPRVWNEWWGCLWLSVAGRRIGDPNIAEMVWSGLGSLKESAGDLANCPVSKLSRYRPHEALSMVMKARYGEVSSIHDQEISRFEVLPLWTGPFFDDWEAVLIPDDTIERFIYREGNGPVSDVLWPKGTFLEAVEEACRDFEVISKGLLLQPGAFPLVRTN